MSLLNALTRVASLQREPFVAPLLARGTHTVYTFQQARPFEVRVYVEAPGWYYLDAQAKPYPNTNELARVEYLEALPRFLVIASFPLDEATWMVQPFNYSDVRQRGWGHNLNKVRAVDPPPVFTLDPSFQPRPVRLVRGSLEPLDLLYVRQMGLELIYDEMDTAHPTHALYHVFHDLWVKLQASPQNVSTGFSKGLQGLVSEHDARIEWRNAFETVAQQVIQPMYTRAVELERQNQLQQAQATLEGRVQSHLDFVGASLRNLLETPAGYVVRYEYNGLQHEVLVNPHAQLISSGICLSGTDRQHNLSSAILVMERARQLNRPGVGHANFLENDHADYYLQREQDRENDDYEDDDDW